MFGIKLPARCRYYSFQLYELHPEVRAMRQDLGHRVGDHSVLEMGCGFGHNARRCQGPYLGVDPDADAVAEARRRNPTRSFGAPADADGEEPHTVLFCLVLHETEERERLLNQAADLGASRVLIYDFDPQLYGVDRLRVSFLEEQAIRSYWGFDPASALGERGYVLAKEGSVGTRVRFWEFWSTAAAEPLT